MYFTNIANKDLEPFHKLPIPNFSITLTDMLTSPLFKVETIQTGSLYKIIPLFYTGSITSTNKDDRILENKAIIAEKKTKETHYTFTNTPGEETLDYIEYGTYYEHGDELTDAQFNSIISLLLKQTIFNDNITLNNGQVPGTYASYTFDIESTTVIDTGILITRETLTNLGTVTLNDPTFNNATYTLKLTVVHNVDVNITEVDDDNTETSTLEVELSPGVAVDIPFETLDYNYVVLKDATVSIKHDKPFIRGVQTNSIGVTGTANNIQQGGTSTLTFTAYDLSNIPSPGQELSIYKDGSELVTLTTNQQGIVTYNYTGVGTGEHTFKAVNDQVNSSNYTINDYLFYDPAKDGLSNDGFIYTNNIITSNDSTGKLVTEISGTGGRRYSVGNPNPSSQYSGQKDTVYTWDTPLVIECDIVSGSDNARIGVRRWDTTTGTYADDIYRTFTQLGLTNGGHLKITYDGTYVKYYINNSTTASYTSSSVTLTRYGVTFLVPTSGSFKYKDFKIYPYEA